MTGDLSGYNQFVRVTRRRKRQRGKANSPVVRVVQLESHLERLSDCRTVPYLRFFLVRNEEAGGSNPLSSTRITIGLRPLKSGLSEGRKEGAFGRPSMPTCFSSWAGGRGVRGVGFRKPPFTDAYN